MNKFEFKNLVKGLKDSLKEKTFFKDLRKEVDTGANGTQDYVVKKGVNKDTVATTKQLLTTVIHLKLYWMRCMFELVNFLKF
tara:strand:- start:87 stop:332 length:246 start_codon:yes stop_codon:yes gene_type:complete